MRKLLIGAVAAAALSAAPAHAAMDCGAMFKKAEPMVMKAPTTEKMVAMARLSIHAYDLCMAGDEFNADKFWQMMVKN